MRNKRLSLLLLCCLLCAVVGCGTDKDVILLYKIDKKDVGKITFRDAPSPKYKNKNDDDKPVPGRKSPRRECGTKNLTENIDTLYFINDTLFITYKKNFNYVCKGTARDGSITLSGVMSVRYVSDKKRFKQKLSVPQRAKYIWLNNHDYKFLFQQKSSRKYAMIEYHLLDSTAQNKCFLIENSDTIPSDLPLDYYFD